MWFRKHKHCIWLVSIWESHFPEMRQNQFFDFWLISLWSHINSKLSSILLSQTTDIVRLPISDLSLSKAILIWAWIWVPWSLVGTKSTHSAPKGFSPKAYYLLDSEIELVWDRDSDGRQSHREESCVCVVLRWNLCVLSWPETPSIFH